MKNPHFRFCLNTSLKDYCNKKNAFEKDLDKHIRPEDFIPQRSEILDAGWDVKCAAYDCITLWPGKYVKIPLGIRVFAPNGWWLRLVPRSSTFIKKHINSLYGTIDEGVANILKDLLSKAVGLIGITEEYIWC